MTGYTCCNLRADGGWISSNNVQGGPILRAGQPIELSTIKRKYYVYGTVGSVEYGFRDDSASTEEDTIRWIRRLIVDGNPARKVATWPFDVRQAISVGMVFEGMTREQVLISLGHPSPADTPEISANTWRYWTLAQDLPVDLIFDASGILTRLEGNSSAVRTLVMERQSQVPDLGHSEEAR